MAGIGVRLKHELALRFREALLWRNLRLLLWICLLITTIFAILDYHPNWRYWGLEILRDAVIAVSTGVVCYILAQCLNLFKIKRLWWQFTAAVLVLATGGWLGAWLAWWLNVQWFGFEVSSLASFRNQLAALSIPLGLVPFIAFHLIQRLQKAKADLRAKEMTEQKLIQAKTKAELETLRAKVHPHFLFNTLNSIASLIPDQPVEAEQMIQRLSQLFRYSLNGDNRDFVTLAEEMAMVEAYLEIEKIRLGAKLDFKLVCEPGLSEFPIPNMLLQPLVENAVLHGIANAKSGGSLMVRATRIPSGCQLVVADSGSGEKKQPSGPRFGLSAMMSRLELIYGDGFSLSIKTAPSWSIYLVLPRGEFSVKKPIQGS